MVQLVPCADAYRPVCYRVWIDGRKVGWPPPAPDTTLSGPPSLYPRRSRSRHVSTRCSTISRITRSSDQ
jgi:hypothetical protein